MEDLVEAVAVMLALATTVFAMGLSVVVVVFMVVAVVAATLVAQDIVVQFVSFGLATPVHSRQLAQAIFEIE
jgi:hypothetical protein